MMTDITARIQEGEKDITEGFPSSWYEFRGEDSMSQALKEYIYILNNYDVPRHYDNLYMEVYEKLVESVDSESIDSTNFKEKLNLREINDFSGAFEGISDGILLEACFQFAIFFLCRELIKISGYPENPLNLDADTLEDVFLHSNAQQNPQTSNEYFERYVNAIGVRFESEKKKDFAECFYPIGSNNEFKQKIVNACSIKNNENKQTEVMVAIKSETLDILNGIAISLYKCITNTTGENLNLNTQVYASGDGSETIGFMGIKNLGCFLFPYKNEVVINNKNKITKDNIVHFYAWGYNNFKFSNIEVYIRNNPIWIFKGNKNVYNGLRPERKNNITTRSGYKKNIDTYYSTKENEDDVIRDDYRTKNIYSHMSFDRNTNDLSFDKGFKNGCMNITLVSAYDEINGKKEYDEFFLMANIAQKKVLSNEMQPLTLKNLFDDDKFEVKTNTSMFDMKLNALEKIRDIIKNGSFQVNPPIIEGRYIGKYDYKKVEVNKDYIPSPNSNKTERSSLHKSDKNIRYSEAIIQLDEVQNKINITIWSTTSPVWSRLDERLCVTNIDENKNSFNNNVLNRLNDNYTNTHKILVKNGKLIPIYNQPLAMLRSMGVLEAIAKKLYSMEETSFMKEKMKNMLNSAFAVDKSAESREDSDTSYQLENTISYATYKSFKWYFKDDDKPENEKDYNQYDHSINFDTTENNNN